MVPPEPGEAAGGTDAKLVPSDATGSMDAITRGTLDGVQLLINIVAMLLVFVALANLANAALALLPDVAGSAVTLQRLLGLLMAPLAWLAGIPWPEAPLAGPAPRHQDGPQRVHRVPGSRRIAGGRAVTAQPAAHDLRALRLRQPRQPRAS